MIAERRFIQDNKGSHVGTILSFIVFISFIVFFYVISQPIISSQKSKDISLNRLRNSLQEKLSTDVTEVFIDIETGTSTSCLVFTNIEENLGIGNNVVAKDSDEDLLLSYPSLGTQAGAVVEGIPSDKKVRLIYSEDFEQKIPRQVRTGCIRLGEQQYQVRTVFENNLISERKVIQTLKAYNESYKDLSQDLQISRGDNFGFGFIYTNGTMIGTDESKLNVNIKSEKITLLYADQLGNILEGNLILKIW